MSMHQRIDSVDAVKSKPVLPTGLLQRACDCGQHTGGGVCESCAAERDDVATHRTRRVDGALPSPVRDALRSPGHLLDSTTRGFMEQRFGHDFTQVRVHTESSAVASAEAIGARAYTIGEDIVFGAGAYAPGTAAGRHLIAHELTHALQQRQAPAIQAKAPTSSPRGADEQQADRIADAVMAGSEPAAVAFAAPFGQIQRACTPAHIGAPAGCAPQPSTFIPGEKLVKFNFDCDTFATGQQADLVRFAGTIASTGPVTIHGYASTDGDPTYNQNLSCARALATKTVLEANGVGAARIATQRHGPTPGPVDERRSATIEAPIAPTPPTPAPPPPIPLTVAFGDVDAASSPAGMPERIPPRADTVVGVGVIGFTPPMAPITISVEGRGAANGDLTIDGAATTDIVATSALRLRGTTQTGAGNGGNLRLTAEQGGTRLATSNDFSVSSIPQNWTVTFDSLLTGASRGFVVRDSWESDSGVVADLDETEISEIVDVTSSGGSLAGPGRVSGFLPGDTFTTDTHSSPAGLSSPGFRFSNQVSIFNDRRSGATDITLRNGGYRITRVVFPLPPFGWFFRISKFGSGVTAGGFTSGAGAGSITRIQRM